MRLSDNQKFMGMVSGVGDQGVRINDIGELTKTRLSKKLYSKSDFIKSKNRVTQFGEVFTAEREVNAMLEMVRQETERIESRFLEPACGTGNFLVPVFEKKLAVIKERYCRSQLEFERYAVVGAGSIYGIDILEDNVELCRERLFQIFDNLYTTLYKKKYKDEVRDIVRFILGRNILWGDALSLMTVEEKQEPITFSEWSLVRGSMLKRRDFRFDELLHDHNNSPTLFSQVIISDTGEAYFHPRPVKEYPLTHFLSLHL